MAKKTRRSIVGVALFKRKKDAGVPTHPLAQSGTILPTDKKSEKLGVSAAQSSMSKHRKYHGQQAK